MPNRLISDEEYARLSDQKADDWRHISEVTPTLFGAAGAIFAAAIAEENAIVMMLAPVPLFLGVFHMIRNAKLQLQMITYLAAKGGESGSWERDVAEVRPIVYSVMGERRNHLRRAPPSSWNTWIVISGFTAALTIVVAATAGYTHWQIAAPAGVVIVLLLISALAVEGRTVEHDRKLWCAAWAAHGEGRNIEEAVFKAERSES
jgi:hypothetical protein